MKITKYGHSCLFVEEGGKSFLIDPGNYVVEDGSLSENDIETLDYLLITHEHLDHMDTPFIKKLTKKFPNAIVLSNTSVADILGKEGISVQTKANELVSLEEVPHEEIFMGPAPKNIMLTIAGKLSHPGDSHHFKTSSPILALPIQGSWGSTTNAVHLAAKLMPKVIIPIHDWHWHDKARQWAYGHLETYFKKIEIDFIGLQTGETIEI